MGVNLEKQYIEYYKEMHKDENLYEGSCLELHAQTIKNYISQHKATTLLDYGSGKGIQYSKEKLHELYFRGIMPKLFDPGILEYSKLPEGMFDGVICTDVLEHIPEKALTGVLDEIYSKASKFVYLGICTVLAKSLLPNGENSHVTLKPLDEWVDLVLKYDNIHTHVYCYGETKEYAIIKDGKVIFKWGK